MKERDKQNIEDCIEAGKYASKAHGRQVHNLSFYCSYIIPGEKKGKECPYLGLTYQFNVKGAGMVRRYRCLNYDK